MGILFILIKDRKIWSKGRSYKYQNFIPWSSLIIYLKLGLFEGSRSQHLFMSFANTSGVFLGIVGRMSLFRTSIETCRPVKSKLVNICTFEWWLAWRYLPKDYAIAENICFLRVFLTCNHLRSHPLISSYFSCHVILQPFGPSKIS